MVITILEAHVAPENLDALKQAYQDGIQQLESQIVQTFLINSTTDSTLWRIVTVWHSREALQEMRRSTETPRGVLMFRAAKAEPTLSVFDVIAHASQSARK